MESAILGRATGEEPDLAIVSGATRLRGELELPGDKSISHRALMLALLADGESVITGCGDGADVRSTAAIAARLGARIERLSQGGRTADYRVVSPGPEGLREPAGTLDCGNSGTSLRLFAGILAGLPMTATLDGDASLRGRPVARIVAPLRAMGAGLDARDDDTHPPLTVSGRYPLEAIDWTPAVPSAQVKSAILLAGLRADGVTRVRERVATRDHTERMLRARGVPVRTIAAEEVGAIIELPGRAAVRTRDERVPGDISAAAFWLVAGSIHPDAELTLRDVGVNPTRRAVIDLLRAMGARIDEAPTGTEFGADPATGDPRATLRVRSSELHGLVVDPTDTAAAIDEIPVLCLAATQAHGRTTIRGASELRHKESDRIAGVIDGLTALGARIRADGDDLVVDGPVALRGAVTDSLDDHRLAMTFAVAGLVAQGPTSIGRAPSAAISYPGFFSEIERIRS